MSVSRTEARVPEQPMLFAPTTVTLELKPGAADLIERTNQSLVRRDGVTGEVVWDATKPQKPFPKGRDPGAWFRLFKGNTFEPTIVQPAVDLDGDGLGDVVCAFGQMASLVVLSGKDGGVLWTYTAERDGPGGPQPDGPDPAGASPETRPGTLLDEPAVLDCDRDGTPDVVLTVAFEESLRELQKRVPSIKSLPAAGHIGPVRRVVMAVSGGTGRWIWSHSLDGAFSDISTNARQRGATVVRGRGAPGLVVQVDDRLLRLDPAMGRQAGGTARDRVSAAAQSSTRNSMATASPTFWLLVRARRMDCKR